MLQVNACWTWFNSPRAIYSSSQNAVYFSSSSQSTSGSYNSCLLVTRYDTASSEITAFPISTTLGGDDHNNSSVLVISGTGTANDGKILVAYTGHPTSTISVRRSTSVNNIAAWDSVVTLNVDGTVEQTGDTYEYANLVQLSGDNTGRIYLFYTVNDTHTGGTTGRALDYRYTDDQGATWSSPVRIINPAIGQMYVRLCTDGASRIDIAFTESHPGTGQHMSVWHFYITSTGTPAYKTSDGTSLTLPIDVSTSGKTATKVFDGATTSSGSWIWDIIGNSGNPVIGFAAFADSSAYDHRYRQSRWNGSSWINGTVDITTGGQGTNHGTSSNPDYLYSGEPFYSGGISLNPANPSEVLISTKNASAGWDIQQWTTANNGTSWSKAVDVTSGNTNVAARPCYVISHPSNLALYWQGTYTSYSSYVTNLYSYPPIVPQTVCKDTFTDTTGTSLSSHYADCGGAYTVTGEGTAISSVGRVYETSGTEVCYILNTANGTDVAIQADFVPLSFVSGDRTGILCRLDDTSSNNFYMARLNMTSGSASGGAIELYSSVSGGFTQLGSSYSVPTMTAGNTYTIKMTAIGAAPTYLTVYLNGTSVITYTDTTPASALQTNKRFGFRLSLDTAATSTTGQHIDNFLAVNLPTTATLYGPITGTAGVESTAFTIQLDQPAPSSGISCSITSSVGGDTITSTPIVIASGQMSGTFTITPTVSTTGNRDITLASTTPTLTIAGSPITYDAIAPPITATAILLAMDF